MTKHSSDGFEYVVQSDDTLERIAAHYDCTPSQLMKLNKLASRVIFPGQKIFVPDFQGDQKQQQSTSTIITEQSQIPRHENNSPVKKEFETQSSMILESSKNNNDAKVFERQKIDNEPPPTTTTTTIDDQQNRESTQKFLKLKVKHFTDAEGVVSGVLLVTPNCVMFDPDVSHPLIIENGPDKYSMVAFMDVISSVGLYKDLPMMANNVDSADRIYRSESSTEKEKFDDQATTIASGQIRDSCKERNNHEQEHGDKKNVRKSCSDNFESTTIVQSERICTSIRQRSLSDEFRRSVEEELKNLDIEPKIHMLHKRRDIDENVANDVSKNNKTNDDVVTDELTVNNAVVQQRHVNNGINDDDIIGTEKIIVTTTEVITAASSCPTSTVLDAVDEEESSTGLGNLGNLRRWRMRANTLGGTLVQGTQVVGRTFSLGAKAVVNAPINLVSQISTNIFTQQQTTNADGETTTNRKKDSESDEFVQITAALLASSLEDIDDGRKDAARLRLKQQRELLQRLKKKTAEMRENTKFTCVSNKDEHPYLFTDIEDMLPYPMHDVCTELPYYLCIKLLPVDKRKSESTTTFSSVGDENKSEFWYTCPRQKADTLYAFLIQWSPEKYGKTFENTNAATNGDVAEETGFVVLDGTETLELGDDSAFQPNSFPASLNLNREWEIVTVEEVKRRLSMLDLSSADVVPLPDGADRSLLLNEPMIRELVDVLPARAQGYPWVLIYSSEAHGFSLSTMYRNMNSWEEELSPVLLVIKDSNQNVFGAVVSCPLRLSDTFYGSGESLLFTFYPEFRVFPWKGANNFIAKGNREGLAIGAGRGRFGLWLDGDLYRGRTQKCQTFENQPLTSAEDFLIDGIEAFGFRLDYL